ncbi:MAG: TetR family transcriptional regulator [Eubacterium sp.]|nr:TetR family transcriptional regulator [Eubacterium sp.]
MAKKSGAQDLRIIRTQKHIKQAFYDLIKEKGFDQMTVKDITDKAMISRNTFYLHYSDKYDLLNKQCDGLMRNLFFKVGRQIHEFKNRDHTVEGVASIISYGIKTIAEDKEYYSILLSDVSSDILTTKMTDTIKSSVRYIHKDEFEINDFQLTYIVSGMTGIIKYYLTNDVDDIDEECRKFADLHLSKIIEMHKLRNQEE